jgi:hypothetical protein
MVLTTNEWSKASFTVIELLYWIQEAVEMVLTTSDWNKASFTVIDNLY